MKLKFFISICLLIIIVSCNSGYHEDSTSGSTNNSDTAINKNNNQVTEVNPNSQNNLDTVAQMASGENTQQNKNLVIGEWKFNDNEDMGDDNQSSIIMNGTVSFNSDNVYNYSANIVANVYNKETQLSVPLSYKYEETGKWSVDDNNIMSQTVMTNRLTANNDAAQEFENDNPNGGVRDVIPLEGTESHFEVKNLTSNLLDLVEQNDKHRETVYHRQ